MDFEMGSKGWANEQLRFAIRILKGEGVVATWKGRLQIVLYVKKRLLAYGFWWQAERIENWIHRLQPREADSLRRRREGFIESEPLLDVERVEF